MRRDYEKDENNEIDEMQLIFRLFRYFRLFVISPHLVVAELVI
jgi:hypothetical protein